MDKYFWNIDGDWIQRSVMFLLAKGIKGHKILKTIFKREVYSYFRVIVYRMICSQLLLEWIYIKF